MKLFVPALAFAFAQLLALGATKQAVDVSFPSHAVTFLEVDDALMPRNNLLASGFNFPPPTSCTTTSSGPDVDSSELILQLLVSKCFSDEQLEQARAWIAPFVPMFTIEIAPVPGACTPAQSQLLLSNDDGDDEDRFKIFSDVGTVVDIFGESSTTAPPATAPTNGTALLSDQIPNRLVGVVSLVDSYSSLRLVQEYELKVNVASAIVVVCGQNGVNCPTTCATCTVTANILLVDTYHITRRIECPHSSNAIPVSYLDGNGNRACVCQCPTGWKRAANGRDCQVVGGSVGTCSWSVPNGFLIQNTATAPTTCSISSITDKGVSVPVAIDNYVAKGRTNAYTVMTDLSTGPHIDLKTARTTTRVVNVANAPAFPTSYPNLYSTLTGAQLAGATDETDASDGASPADTLYTWEDYRGARKAKIDSLTYSKYGKFSLEIDATDYETSATCQGCVAIVDNVRPTATQTCTTSTYSDLVPTSDNIATINTKIASYFAYASTATNDACSADRCDAKTVDVLPLLGSAYATGSIDHSSTAASAFFSAAGVRSALNALPAFTDAELAQPTPVAPGQCKSCLKLWTSLKEWWIDYSCGRDYAVKKCEGASTAQTCTFEQCYVASGTTISAATAAIKSTVQTASQNVLDQLDDHIVFNTLTQVHFALSHCTQFATGSEVPTAACKRAVSISDLFDLTSPDAGILGFSDTELASLVKWRYKIDTDPWGTWSSSVPSYDFKQASTPVVVEAWTKCGRVYRFEFKIHLHLSAPSHVCDHFLPMWYQTTHAPNTPSSTTFCTYPKADFAEVTFDYPANIGLMHARDKLKMNIKEVQCRLKYNWLPTSGASAAVISSTKLNGNVIQRLAVQAKRTDTTAARSAFHVACDFKYQVYDSPDLYVQTCDQDFAIKDCTDPKIDEPSALALTDKSCAADSCVGSSLPGAYEACGGNVVSASGDDTVINTGADQSCCQFCSTAYTTTCKKLPQLPTGHEDIKLCLPSPNNAAPVDYDNGPNLVLSAKTESLFDSSVVSSPTATVLAGASAMVVVVALVVVRRRRAVAEAAAVDADAYYALLG